MPRVIIFVVTAVLTVSPVLAEAAEWGTDSGSAQATGTIVVQPAGAPGQAPGIPPRDSQQPKTGTARIRGRVFAADTGQPLRKAHVRAFSPELRDNRMTSTDANGAYELKDLPAGRYSINASKGSYVSLSYGQVKPVDTGKPLEILEGQTVEKVDFKLPRGAIITGRVVDEFGEPIADVQVMPVRYMFMQGRRRLQPFGRSSATNDIGEFRIFGLAPGQYFLAAVLRNTMYGESDDRSGYAPTYYPGTSNVAEAQRLTVGVGQTLSDISVTLIPARTARVTGIVVDAEGQAVARGYVNAVQRTGGIGMGMGSMGGGQIRPNGSFPVSGLAPGDYLLQVNTSTGSGPRQEFGSAVVSVDGEDVNGVRLVMARMSIATGHIVVDGPADSIRPAAIRVNASPIDSDMTMMMGGGGGAAKDDWTFELRTRPPRLAIRAFGPSADWTLKAVRLKGADVTDSGIEFKPNEDISGIEIELTTKATQVSGQVTNGRGEPAKDYTVIVFAHDQQRW